jgi:hypothetical protein
MGWFIVATLWTIVAGAYWLGSPRGPFAGGMR